LAADYHERDEPGKHRAGRGARRQGYLKPSNRTLGEFIPTKAPDAPEIPARPMART